MDFTDFIFHKVA